MQHNLNIDLTGFNVYKKNHKTKRYEYFGEIAIDYRYTVIEMDGYTSEPNADRLLVLVKTEGTPAWSFGEEEFYQLFHKPMAEDIKGGWFIWPSEIKGGLFSVKRKALKPNVMVMTNE
jgi:hypothetical protein